MALGLNQSVRSEELGFRGQNRLGLSANDPRATGRPGTGFDGRTFTGNNDVQNLEVFGVNERAGESRFAGTTSAIMSAANPTRSDSDAEAARRGGLASAARDVAEGTFERQTRGMDLSDRQKVAAKRKLSLTRSIAENDASSSGRRGITDRAQIARQAGSALEDVSFDQELAGLTSLANAEGQRSIREADEKASKKSARNSTIGTVVGAGLSLLSMFSSEELKDKIDPNVKLLDKLKTVRVEKWKYKDGKHAHVGPYAEEFNDTFGVNQENRGLINIVDALGVTMGAIKELDQKVSSLNAR